jgi:hypothetical protein
MDKVNDSIRLVENRVTEIQGEAENSIQKVNEKLYTCRNSYLLDS